MMKAIRHISCLLLLCVALFAAGCQDDIATKLPANIQQGEGDVTLSLNVSVGGSAGSGTRADFTKEQATDKYEMIHTLRVIIVREDETVEFNRLVDVTEPVGEIKDLEFEVSTSLGKTVTQDGKLYSIENKHVYLVANEASIPDPLKEGGIDIKKLLREVLKRGERFSYEQAKNLLLWNEWEAEVSDDSPSQMLPKYALPIIDNGVDEEEKKYVVMTEFFNFQVTSDLSSGTLKGKQVENLFITRNFVKFRFSIDAVEGTQPFKVASIQFDNLMQKEYLFPRCEYSPSKYPFDGTPREITKYSVPSSGSNDNFTRPYVFTPQNFSWSGEVEPVKYNPLLYFCESKNFKANADGICEFDITVTLEFEGEGDNPSEIVTYKPQTIPSLQNPSLNLGLPRNTIVEVNMTLDKQSLQAEVTVLPYTGVWLNPSFGIDR